MTHVSIFLINTQLSQCSLESISPNTGQPNTFSLWHRQNINNLKITQLPKGIHNKTSWSIPQPSYCLEAFSFPRGRLKFPPAASQAEWNTTAGLLLDGAPGPTTRAPLSHTLPCRANPGEARDAGSRADLHPVPCRDHGGTEQHMGS